MNTVPTIVELLTEYDRALAYTDELTQGLSADEISWRASPNASAIGWHLGHQAAVAHYMVRNLTAAEPRIDPELDALMDSATDEPQRGELPSLERLWEYRRTVADRVRLRVGNIEQGNVGAPIQLRLIAQTMMIAIINHEYQHSKWIAEVRGGPLGHELPPTPTSALLTSLDGYVVIGAATCLEASVFGEGRE